MHQNAFACARFAPRLIVTAMLWATADPFAQTAAAANTPQQPATLRPGLPAVVHPDGNPPTPAKQQLGKALFWEEQMSASGTMACGTCHRPEGGGSDPRTQTAPAAATHTGFDERFSTADDIRGSLGVIRQLADGSDEPARAFGLQPQVTSRRTPSVINAAFASSLFWDGRAEGALVAPATGIGLADCGVALEIQAASPPLSPVEMAHAQEDWHRIASRIAHARPLALASDLPTDLAQFVAGRGYPALFADAFGTPDVTPTRILFALAAYQRTLVSDQSRWDDYLAGDANALTPFEQVGRDVFFGAGNCHT